MSVVWGIDTATTINSSYLNCIESNYGKPGFVGRYMESNPGISDGLSTSEMDFLHGSTVNIPILLIWNNFTSSEVSTYAQGQSAATSAINYAYSSLGVPAGEGKAIFADIEEGYPVTSEWLQGWADTFFSYNPTGASNPAYAPGFYANPENGDFPSAFCTASGNDSNVSLTYLWANDATVGVTDKSKAPTSVSPQSKLTCKSLLIGWQYGAENTDPYCTNPIDTDVWNSSYTGLFW